ncbi:hypothetical protein EOA27_20955 [Mesorhizobium sp. M2A.F.Ca.ET.037.01.1.1]|nr:hypothetical protein EOA27_20955 [Mesorhizobium sp. M2A.F.Ca.ET.037.01.1.1]RWN92559.1 MAG: hypothetical protein EOS06_32525 [Mesorhizobium sp.]TIV42753.1 MAG: hypothetical protein E5V76_00110 [Mesorhizobium sp.]TJU73274.1 MAG: hypothetical protein E5Y15_32950 [Mesorhizobium sp.]
MKNHDAAIRIGGEAPGGGPILQRGVVSHVSDRDHHHLGSLSADAIAAAKLQCSSCRTLLHALYRTQGYSRRDLAGRDKSPEGNQ